MGVEEAKKTFNRLMASLLIVSISTLLLSYFLNVTPTGNSYTGHALLTPIGFSIIFILTLLVIGVIFLMFGIGMKSK